MMSGHLMFYYMSLVCAHLLLTAPVLGSHSGAGHTMFAPHRHGSNGQSMFFEYDRNSDGVVNGMELYSVLTFLERNMGYKASESRTILNMVDLNKDDQLDFWDFRNLELLLRTESLQHRRR